MSTIRFKRYRNTGLIRAFRGLGEEEVYAIIGKVSELKRLDLVTTEGPEPEGVDERWLVLRDYGSDIAEYETLEAAKAAVRREA